MSGHSKWSTIKHKKAAVDAKRGKLFTRLAMEITVAAREGGGEVEFNNRLALAVQKAKNNNMPKENIERAIKRGTGDLEGVEYYEFMYEAYGPHGIGVLIECVTDNKNRAIADVRHAVNKYGGNMASAGAVSWNFTRKGYIMLSGEFDEDEIFMVAAEAGADDVQFSEGTAEIYVELDSFQAVQKALAAENIKFDEASVIYDPNNETDLAPKDTLQVMDFIEKLEDVDDVQNVYSTLNVTDEAIAALENA